MKSYTDLEQSKKLAEILPIESADMYRVFENNAETRVYYGKMPTAFFVCEPCWSLAALLGVLEHPRCFQGDKPTYWFCGCFGKDKLYHEVEADNPVDACVAMIEKLNGLNLL